jgi:hypothetical protein
MHQEQRPSFQVVVPGEAVDFDLELHSPRHAILVGDCAKVTFQLTLGREQFGPAWILADMAPKPRHAVHRRDVLQS